MSDLHAKFRMSRSKTLAQRKEFADFPHLHKIGPLGLSARLRIFDFFATLSKSKILRCMGVGSVKVPFFLQNFTNYCRLKQSLLRA